MQKTQQSHEELLKVYAMIGTVVMAMAGDGLETTRLRVAGFIREAGQNGRMVAGNENAHAGHDRDAGSLS